MSTELQYPRVFAAAMKGESALWEIGDALIDAIGKPPKNGVNDQSYKKIEPVAAELVEHGIEQYSVKYLAIIRETAAAFPAPNRVRGVSWTAHQVAGSPDFLKAVMEAAKAQDIKHVSKRFVINVRDSMYADDKAKRKRVHGIAVKAREQAENAHEKATREKKEARDIASRRLAEKREQEAAAKAKRAKDRERKLRSAPTPKPADRKAPDPADVPMMLVKTKFMADSSEAKALVRRMDREISPHIDELSKAFVVGTVEELLEIADAFRKLAAKINRNQVNKRAHLHAVDAA